MLLVCMSIIDEETMEDEVKYDLGRLRPSRNLFGARALPAS